MNKNKDLPISAKSPQFVSAKKLLSLKSIAVMTSGAVLSACVAGPGDSSQSSVATPSSQSQVSSQAPVSSSSTAVSSSSMAAVSSAPVITAPVDCGTVDAGAGAQAFVGSSCSGCHGGVNEAAGSTPGGAGGPALNFNNYVKFDENSTSLNVYIATKMMNFGGGCAAGDSACEATANNIATYLNSLSNNPWCESTPASSAPVASSSMAVVSSSSSSASDQAAGPGTENTLLTSTGEFAAGVEGFDNYIHTTTLASINWSGAANVTINDASDQPWHVQVIHDADIRAGESYTLCFDAKAEFTRDIEIDIDNGHEGSAGLNAYTTIVSGAVDVTLSTQYERYTHTFTATESDSTGRVIINLGISDGDVSLDNIGLYYGTQCNQENTLPPPPPPPPPGEEVPSEGCGQAPGQTANQPIGNGNSYLVQLPQNYDRNKAYPVYFDFHNTSSDGPRYSTRGDGFSRDAKNNAIFVFPTARNVAGGWGNSDFQMFEPLYNRITSQFCVNKAAVFATGYSSGGDYSGMIACEHGDKVTAIAPVNPKHVNGYDVRNPSARSCKDKVKAIIIYGNNDTVLGNNASGRDMTEFYRVKNGCSTNTVTMSGYPQCKTYQGCVAGGEVSFCTHNFGYGGDGSSNGAGHGYPSWTTGMFWEATAEFR